MHTAEIVWVRYFEHSLFVFLCVHLVNLLCKGILFLRIMPVTHINIHLLKKHSSIATTLIIIDNTQHTLAYTSRGKSSLANQRSSVNVSAPDNGSESEAELGFDHLEGRRVIATELENADVSVSLSQSHTQALYGIRFMIYCVWWCASERECIDAVGRG